MNLVAWFVMGCALGCAIADAQEGQWDDVLVSLVAAGLCVGAIL